MVGYSIRKATIEDLEKMQAWLKQEDEAGIEGSFLCNFSILKKGQAEGTLTVLARNSDSMPIAYCEGGNNLYILAVKADYRGRGFGKYLANYFIDNARARNLIGLDGECAPSSSKPFWLRMGFTSVPFPWGYDEKPWVALPLPHDHELVVDMPRHQIEIILQNNSYCMESVFKCEATFCDGFYDLERDFVHFIPNTDTHRIIEILINGKTRFKNEITCLSNVFGEHEAPWIRIRELSLDE